eukprot:scaffold84072_cov53-Phaeocystis_antarctica.AAC.1
MWQTWLTRVAQAAGAVQAGVGQTGRRDAGGRAAGGVRGAVWVQGDDLLCHALACSVLWSEQVCPQAVGLAGGPGRTIARAPRRAGRCRRDSATTLLVAFPPTALAVTAEAAVFGATTVFVKIPCRLGPIWAICNHCDISVVSTVYFTKVPSSYSFSFHRQALNNNNSKYSPSPLRPGTTLPREDYHSPSGPNSYFAPEIVITPNK